MPRKPLLLWITAFHALTGAAAAQRSRAGETPARPGAIGGLVVDAATGSALVGATITLTAADEYGVVAEPAGGAARFALARSTVTSVIGEYNFNGLPIGSYRLLVKRIGYMPTTLDVELGETASSPLSIGLVIAPVRLRPVEVRAAIDGGVFTRDRTASADDARMGAARARQRTFLSTDARELTNPDVEESATLAGGDVLRALERLPGVTPFDDWSAKLLVRGNRWDHDRVYFDDLPLFDPLGALGRASGVNADAIGAAFLHPGVRPVSLGGEGAARVDLRSRPASSVGNWQGSTALSSLGISGSAARLRDDEAAGVAISAQHSVANWLSSRGAPWSLWGDPAARDAQATLRVDARLGPTRALEMSALVDDDVRELPAIGSSNSSQAWGNAGARLTLRALIGSVATSNTIGISHFGSHADHWIAQASHGDATENPVSLRSLRSNVDYLTFGGRATPLIEGHQSLPTFGYDITEQQSSLSGPRQSIFWGELSDDPVRRADRLIRGDLWVDDRATLGERLTVESGVRLDAGGMSPQPAGSLQARLAVSTRTWLSAGASRVHQYVQGIGLPVVAAGPTAPTLWLTSGNDVPVMTVDNAMLGVERWFGDDIIAAANAYLRRTNGEIIADPAPGPLSQRPLFVDAAESAHGVEVSARKLTGHFTGLVAYSYNVTTTHAEGWTFPSSATRPHSLDATAALHAGGTRFGAAYVIASGAPFTRVALTSSTGGTPSLPFTRDAPNTLRLPAYSTLDLFVDHAHALYSGTIIGFAGLQNVLGRKNLTWYQLSGICDGEFLPANSCPNNDIVSHPVGVAPTIGVRFVF